MAIVIEEGKRPNLLWTVARILGWLAILAVIGVAAYYIFFVTPPFFTVPAPAGLQSIQSLSQATLQPNDVLQNPTYVSLKPSPVPAPASSGPAIVGRVNPFIVP